MFGAITRRLMTGGALLLTAFLAADAAGIDDDLPDLNDQVGRMAAEVALELQQVCPPASPSDQAAFDRCRRSLFGDSALRRNLAPRLLWGRRNQDAGAALELDGSGLRPGERRQRPDVGLRPDDVATMPHRNRPTPSTMPGMAIGAVARKARMR